MVILLLFSAIFIIMILFPKLIPITLIIIAIIIALLTIILVIMIAIASIKYAIEYIILIFSFRRLVRILPALINELKGKLPKDIEQNPTPKPLRNPPNLPRILNSQPIRLDNLLKTSDQGFGVVNNILSQGTLRRLNLNNHKP